MTDKKAKTPKETPETDAPSPDSVMENGALAEASSESAEETLKKQLEEAQARAAEYLDGWQRSQAEFSNYKKRLEREQSAMSDMMRAQNIKKFLPVVDDLERALANRPSEAEAWVNGIELIYRKLTSILDSEGVTRIEAVGQPFDPNLHEAIAQEPSDTVASGHVIDVVQAGYMLGDRVIRHALVRVAA
ncbi:MAG: nucleotide exchange factor GrpE [Anaerolineales bacterium]